MSPTPVASAVATLAVTAVTQPASRHPVDYRFWNCAAASPTRSSISRSTSGPSSLNTLIADHERASAAFASLARRVRDEGRLDDTFRDHYGLPMTYGGAILMVILHNEAHRTEVLHIFARLGVPELAQVEVDHGLWDFKRRGLLTDQIS